MTTITHKSSVKTTHKMTVGASCGEHPQLGPIWPCRIDSVVVTCEGGASDFHMVPKEVRSTEYRLVHQAGLDAFDLGGLAALKACPEVPHTEGDLVRFGGIFAVRAGFVAALAQHGCSGGLFAGDKIDIWADHLVDGADLMKVKADDHDVVLVEHYAYSGMVFDMAGNALSQPIVLEYIEAGLSNRDYDLDVAVEILMQDARVELLPEGGEHWRRRGGREVERVGTKWAIGDIPYYNADPEEGRTKCLMAVLRLTPEQFHSAYRAVGGTRNDILHHVLNNDGLGLITGGAARDMPVGPFVGRYATSTVPNPAYRGTGPLPVPCHCGHGNGPVGP